MSNKHETVTVGGRVHDRKVWEAAMDAVIIEKVGGTPATHEQWALLGLAPAAGKEVQQK